MQLSTSCAKIIERKNFTYVSIYGICQAVFNINSGSLILVPEDELLVLFRPATDPDFTAGLELLPIQAIFVRGQRRIRLELSGIWELNCFSKASLRPLLSDGV